MKFKAKGDVWTCNNQCGSNCCGYIYLVLDGTKEEEFKQKREFLAEPGYTDWRWLGMRSAFTIIKLDDDKRNRVIKLNEGVDFEIKFNPFIKKNLLYVKNKCENLLEDNKCKIYRNRPDVCKKGPCYIFDRNPSIRFYGEPILEANPELKQKLHDAAVQEMELLKVKLNGVELNGTNNE